MSAAITIDEILDEFEFLGDWEEQCRYLIELGEELPELAEGERIEANRVHGCQSNVWFVPTIDESNGRPRIEIRAKSDAKIVDGLIQVLLALVNGRTADDILATDFPAEFARLGLETHLVPQRRNGLFAMVERVRSVARAVGEVEQAEPITYPETVDTEDDPLRVAEDGRKHEPLDVPAVRAQFPALQKSVRGGRPVIFLDTGASSQKPQCVIDAESDVYESYYANAYRGVYEFGDRVSGELEKSRETIRRFIGAESTREIVFTPGTTMAINLVAHGWGTKFLKPRDEILLSVLEHHANIVPWQMVAERTGAVIRWIPLADDGQLDLERLDEVLTERTRIVPITGMSNVLGTVPPIATIARRAKAVGAVVLVDGAQSVPHLPTRVVDTGIDFLAFSGHKLYGPSGVGVLYGRADLLEAMDPFLGGGHMIDRVTTEGFTPAAIPAKFEAGTLPIAQAIGLGRAVEFVRDLDLCAVHAHEQSLTRYAHERLTEVPGLRILGPTPEHKGSIVSFTMDGAAAQDIASLLDLRGVCVRHGHHCTMPLHDHLGIPNSVRASLGVYNTKADIDALVDALAFARNELHL